MDRAGTESARPDAIVLPTPHAKEAAVRVDPHALMNLARRGDLAAWSTLYQQSYASVYRQLCYLTGDTVLAEDFTQESFARAFTSMAEYDGRGTFVAWVRGIGLNLVRMHWRRVRTTSRVHGDLQQASTLEDTRSDSELDHRHHQAQRMRMLYEVLDTLPERLREAFVLRELQGLSLQEAADQLRVSPGNLAVRASRARDRIRRELQRRGWLTEEA